ncbi:hypothetical protein [Marinomonas algicola]|uniref:hypothetical protein n=1 Tax=Marinomonas algicola TaxID=2773454 RepID=UPI0017486E85|nr:hypothetical protein [Marinomonas algicola]
MYSYFLQTATLWSMMLNNESLDTYLGVSGVITQTELPIIREQGRLGEYAVVYRVYREKQGGGFGDQVKHPYAWSVLVYIDSYLLSIHSARGERREWANLDSAAQWLMSNGFHYWWTRNDIEKTA